jgi:hypothetical protein
MPEVQINITAKDRATVVIKKVNKGFGSLQAKAKAAFELVKKHALAVGVAITAVAATLKKMFDIANEYASYQAQRDALTGLAAKYGETADSITDAVKTSSDGMITLADATDIAAKALGQDMHPEQLEELAAAAVTVANVQKMGVAEALTALTQGVSKLEMGALEAAVGMIDLNEELGEAAAGMTRTQQRAATYEIVMGRVKAMQEETTATSWNMDVALNQLGTDMSDLGLTIQKYVTKAFLGVISASAWFFAGLTNLIGVLALAGKAVYDFAAAIIKADIAMMKLDFSGVIEHAKEAASAILDIGSQENEFADKMFRMGEAAKKASQKYALLATANLDSVAAENRHIVKMSEAMKAAKKLDEEIAAQTVSLTDQKEILTESSAAWGKLTEKVKAARDEQVAALKDQVDAYESWRTKTLEQETTYAELQRSIRRTTMTDEEKYVDDWNALDAKLAAARALSGQAQIDALSTYQEERAAMLEKSIAQEAAGDVTSFLSLQMADETAAELAAIEQEKEWARQALQTQYEEDIATLEAYVGNLTAQLDNVTSKAEWATDALDTLSMAAESKQTFELDVDWQAVQEETVLVEEHLKAIGDEPVKINLDSAEATAKTQELGDEIEALGKKRVKVPVELVLTTASGKVVSNLEEALAERVRNNRSELAEALNE